MLFCLCNIISKCAYVSTKFATLNYWHYNLCVILVSIVPEESTIEKYGIVIII